PPAFEIHVHPCLPAVRSSPPGEQALDRRSASLGQAYKTKDLRKGRAGRAAWWRLFLHDCAVMADGAGIVLVLRINVEKRVPVGTEILQVLTAALRQDQMAVVATAGAQQLFVLGEVLATVAPETAVRILVTAVIGIGPPVGLHFREEVPGVNSMRFLDELGQ